VGTPANQPQCTLGPVGHQAESSPTRERFGFGNPPGDRFPDMPHPPIPCPIMHYPLHAGSGHCSGVTRPTSSIPASGRYLSHPG